MIRYEKLYEDLSSWNKNGVNSLNYNELKRKKINDNTTQIKVDLLKKMDEKKYPHLYDIRMDNYQRLKGIIKNERKKLSILYI
jgi:predicted methyltransferase